MLKVIHITFLRNKFSPANPLASGVTRTIEAKRIPGV